MPSLGADMESAKVSEWLIAPGDAVERNQIVLVIETTKGAIDVEIFEDGVIDELLVPEGVELAVGEPLALYHRPGEPAATRSEGGAPGRAEPLSARSGPVTGDRPAHAIIAETVRPGSVRSRISPLARRRATELGVDTGGLSGSGPGGAIVLLDVERAAAASREEVRAAAAAESDEPVAEMRRAIAAAMTRSKREAPHYYLGSEICLARAMAWLEQENARRPVEARLIPAALLYRAVVLALGAVPELNGCWGEGGADLRHEIHLGVVVSLKKHGLVVPAVLNAETRPLDALMGALQDVSGRARTGRLRASELSSATFSVTNLGERGVDFVIPVIYPPQLAIVGFGRIRDRVVAEGGAIAIRPTVMATLAGDHRASDGYHGARFLNELDKRLQAPMEL